MLSNEEYEKILRETKNEFPDFEIIQKNASTLMSVIDVFLKLVSFGRMKTFKTGFITAIGNKVYVPQSWVVYPPAAKSKIIRHERIHMRQSKKYGRMIFSLLYVLTPLPIGFAYFRRKFEQEAYEESLGAVYEYLGEKALRSPELKKETIENFIGPNYLWTWLSKKDIESWYDSVVEKIASKQD